eukprot:c18269_g1_i4 orf=396-1175(-)
MHPFRSRAVFSLCVPIRAVNRFNRPLFFSCSHSDQGMKFSLFLRLMDLLLFRFQIFNDIKFEAHGPGIFYYFYDINLQEWMVSLGFAHQKTVTTAVKTTKEVRKTEDKDSKEALMKIAASALAAAKDTSLTSKEGKLVVSEVRDFAGEEIKVTKLIDPNSKAAEELKRRQSSSGVDKLLQQIEKKQKINVLDKSRKDWTEFKEEKQIEEELESYKKSGDKYTDRVAFLQRSDLREYERERDARLSLQAKKPGDISYIED